MNVYETLHMVKSEDLNIHGTLFAARSAAWFVEAAFTAVACEYGVPEEIVCRNMHGMSFTSPIRNGDVILLRSRIARVGRTSVTVHVDISSKLTNQHAVDGYATFVIVDVATGRPKPHSLALDAPADEAESDIRARAAQLF